MKSSVLIISSSNTKRDPRVLRQIDALANDFEVDVAGFSSPNSEIRNFHNIAPIRKAQNLWTRKLLKAWYLLTLQYSKLFRFENGDIDLSNLRRFHYKLLVVNDFNCLPLAKQISLPTSKILLDAHEYFFGEFNSRFQHIIHKKYRNWLAETYFPIVHSMITVSNRIAKLYEGKLGLAPVSVVRNIPNAWPSQFISHSSSKIEMIHHGSAVKGRGIEDLINLIPLLDSEFRLNLMLVDTDKQFFNSLKQMASRYGNRISFLPVVQTEAIVNEIKKFDLGIHIIPPTSVNNKFALPNKFFEFIHAHLCVITGPSPEMASLIQEYSIGYTSESFKLGSIATLINSLDRRKIEQARYASFKASANLNWKQESVVLRKEVHRLLNITD